MWVNLIYFLYLFRIVNQVLNKITNFVYSMDQGLLY